MTKKKQAPLLNVTVPWLNVTVWSKKQIDAAIDEALRAAKKMTRKALEANYSAQTGHIHMGLNDKAKLIKRCIKLQTSLDTYTKILELTLEDSAVHKKTAKTAGWNDALEAAARKFEKAYWNPVTGAAGAAKIRELKR
jgi:flavin-binding protein dodecin